MNAYSEKELPQIPSGSGSLFYDHPRLTALSILIVLIAGFAAWGALPRQEDPTMTERWARVQTWIPGATAERVESLVSEPIEAKLREIPEVRQLSSTSRAGFSLVEIELYDAVGSDEVDVVWSQIRDKLGEINPDLPAGSTVPELKMSRPLAVSVVVELSWTGPSEPQLSLMTRLARSLELQLANLGGTEETDLFGEPEEEILIALDPHRLARAGLDPSTVAAKIADSDTKNPSGRLQAPGSEMLVEVDAELDSAERIGRIPMRTSATGQMLRVADLGEITKTLASPPRSIALHDGQQVMFIAATMQPGLNIGDWSERARTTIATFAGQLPAAIRAEIVFDQSAYTGGRMQSLGLNLVASFVIVVVLLLWLMGLRAALIVSIALPLSSAMVLAAMQALDIPLHQMSVTGLIISLGLLIDNAIVIVDDYRLRTSRGVPAATAIAEALRQMTMPLFASTATTVLAFLPIAFAPGGVGDFTGTLGSTVCLAVGSSFIVSITVIPALAAFIDRRWPEREGNQWWRHGYVSESLSGHYRRSIEAVLRRPGLGIGAGLVLPMAGFLLFPTLTNQFFPAVDRDQFQVQVQLPAHASIQETTGIVRRLDQLLRKHPDIVDSRWSIGESSPRIYYNAIGQGDGIPGFAQGWVTTISAEATRKMLPALQLELMAAVPEGEVKALPFEQGPPVSAPVELRIVGPDADVLRAASLDLRQRLGALEGVTYTRSMATSSEPKLVFEPHEIPAADAGMTTGDFTRQLAGALMGIPAGTVQEGNTEIGVRVRLGNSHRDDVGDLASLPVPTAGGDLIPLDQLGTWRLSPAAAGIERYQGERVSTVQGYVLPFTLPASVLDPLLESLEAEDFRLPPGYRLEIAGEAEESAGASGGLAGLFALFATLMFAVVTLSMNSFRYTMIIGLVAVLSFGLALFGVRLFGYPFGYMALIGALGMIGIAINGAIIVLSVLNADPLALQGDVDAMTERVVDSTRHIIATTATTIGGFLPLVVAGGQFWPPLATAIAGGVIGSAVIALYTVPALFRMMRKTPANADHQETLRLNALRDEPVPILASPDGSG